MKWEILLTPPLLANLLIAGLVIPSMFSLAVLLVVLLIPTLAVTYLPFPNPYDDGVFPPVVFPPFGAIFIIVLFIT